MPACAVYGCGSYSRKTKGSDIRYYSFPKDEHLCKQWVNLCRRQDKFNVRQGCICSKHFHPTAFFKTLKQELLNYAPKTGRDLKKDAIPTEFLPNQKKSFDTSKNQRRQKRDEIKNRALIISEVLEQVTEAQWDTPDKLKEEDQTQIVPEDIIMEQQPLINSDPTEETLSAMKNVIEHLKKDNMNLRKENETLQQNLASVSTKLDSINAVLVEHFRSAIVQECKPEASKVTDPCAKMDIPCLL